MCGLKISCDKIAKDLAKHGITDNKSHECKFPNAIPSKFINHYIRGLIDGDGFLSIIKSNHQMIIGLCSSTGDFLSEVQNVLMKECNLKTKTSIQNRNNTYFSFAYGGSNQCFKIYNYLYSSNGPYLHRKYKKATNHFKSIGLL